MFKSSKLQEALHIAVLYEEGTDLHEEGAYEQALSKFNAILQSEAEAAKVFHAKAYYYKGMTLHDMIHYEEAIVCYDKAIEIDPSYSLAYNSKGFALKEMKRYEEAMICYNRAIEIDPCCVEAYNNKGLVLDELKQYEEAIACFDKSIEVDPDCTTAYNNKGLILRDMKRYDEAISCYDEAIRVAPNDVDAYKHKAKLLYSLQLYQEAINCNDEVLKIGPNAISHYNNAMILMKLGNKLDALRCSYNASNLVAQDEQGNVSDDDFAYIKTIFTTEAQELIRDLKVLMDMQIIASGADVPAFQEERDKFLGKAINIMLKGQVKDRAEKLQHLKDETESIKIGIQQHNEGSYALEEPVGSSSQAAMSEEKDQVGEGSTEPLSSGLVGDATTVHDEG